LNNDRVSQGLGQDILGHSSSKNEDSEISSVNSDDKPSGKKRQFNAKFQPGLSEPKGDGSTKGNI